MLMIPQKGLVRVEHNVGTVGDATPGTQVTTGGTSSTKGSVAECIASTSFDAYMLWVSASEYHVSATDSNLMVDILTGSATEEVLIADLMLGGASSGAIGARGYLFPLYIPAGTRIAAQAAGQRTSTAFSLQIYLYGGGGVPPWRVGSRVDTYGVSTVPNGTTITPGASGAEGSWTQITASSTVDHFAILPGFQPGVDTTKGANNYYVDVGVGSATEEEIVQSSLYAISSNEEQFGPIPPLPTFVDIPASTRLTMRVSNSGSNDSGSYNGVLYGVS
jgi:hypothetical protein